MTVLQCSAATIDAAPTSPSVFTIIIKFKEKKRKRKEIGFSYYVINVSLASNNTTVSRLYLYGTISITQFIFIRQ